MNPSTSHETKDYDIIKSSPVARFYYQGKSHTHPVRRTILIIEDLPTLLIGYEMREGSKLRSIKDAPVKSYRKDRIAKYGDYSRLRKTKVGAKKDPSESTLNRTEIIEFIRNGA
mgnify:CR=1 FL=1